MAMAVKNSPVEARHSLVLNTVTNTIKDYLCPDARELQTKMDFIDDARQSLAMKIFLIVGQSDPGFYKITPIIEEYLLPELDRSFIEEICREFKTEEGEALKVIDVCRSFFDSFITREEKRSNENECSICFKPLGFTVQLGCGHIFDLDCVERWRVTRNTCPLDRRIIDPSQMTSITATFSLIKMKQPIDTRDVSQFEFPLHHKGIELKTKIAQKLNQPLDSFVLIKIQGEQEKAEVIHREKYLHETFHGGEFARLTALLLGPDPQPQYRVG